MQSYTEYLEEQAKKEKAPSKEKEPYIELGIGDRKEKTKPKKEEPYIELGIGDR